MRASLMGLDNIYHRHGIMPGAVRSSPAFDNASRALQRLTLDNEAAAAVATGSWEAMEQVLEVARVQNNPVVARRMEVSISSFSQPCKTAHFVSSWSTHKEALCVCTIFTTPKMGCLGVVCVLCKGRPCQ